MVPQVISSPRSFLHGLLTGQTVAFRRHSRIVSVLCLLIVAALSSAFAVAQSPRAGISGNPTTIAAGGSSTLTWSTANAVSADLNGTNVALNGSQVVSPTTTTTYRITAHAANGTTDWGQVTITVTSGGGPTASITANPTTITSGGSSTLTWSSTNATSATLNGASVAVNGSKVVSPTATTTYTFIAKSSSGATATSTATVTVGSGGNPTAGIVGNPTAITAGGSSTLTWTTTNAVSADLNGTNVALNGSQVVSPTATTTYRITAHAANGTTDWGQVTITVTPGSGPTASITANPLTIAPGGSSTLTWSSTNATSATLNGASVAVNGSQVVSPTATTTYTFIAKSSSGATATSTVTVTVNSGGNPTAGIVGNPTTIAAGGSSTLTWITSNAVSADLNGTNVALNGSQVVSPTATTTYRITAHAANGTTDWGQVTITVTPGGGGPTASITANPTTIAAGGSSTLTWSSTNATSATLNGDSVPVNGSESVSPTATTTYTFIAKSSSGATATSTVTVTIGSGGNPTASINANPTTIAPGGSSTLTWSSTNATSALLNGSSVPVNGSQVVSPAATTTYTILVTSASGATASSTATVVVNTGGGPTASINADPITITSGGTSTLTWSSTGATSATLNGASVAVNGSQVVSPTATTTYTFIAKSSSGATATSSATVTVNSGGNPMGQWTPVQNWPFMAAHAHLLPNGKVLFSPSFLIGNNPALWDPIANSFSSSPLAPFNIFCAGHSFLADGTLLIAGGHNGSSGYGLPYATIYDPTQDSWTQIPNMQDARWYPTNTTLPNGDVLVVSGEITPGTNSTLPQIWDPPSNSWVDLTSAQLFQPLYPMMFVAPNGQVFNAGPDQTSRYLNTSGSGAWTTVGTFNYNGTRDYGSAVYYDGKVLIAGGDGSTNTAATKTAEVIDLNASNPQWTNTGSLAFARRQLNLTLLPDGKVLATGGSGGFGFDNASLPIFQSEMWDPATGNWTTMASISVYRGYHSTALLLPDGRVVSAGGEQTGASAEIYSPPYLFNGPRPTITSVSSTSVKFGQTLNVSTPDAASISQITFIRLGSVTHAFNQNQRLVHLQFTQVSGGLQVTAPANGKVAPPGHYMLFLVNSSGVPSVAKIIQVTN